MTTQKRILSGMRSTHPKLHLGNYEGALRNWVKLQGEYKMYCMVADWHALTTMSDEPAEIAFNSREVAKDFVAAGIDPEKSAVFVQSHVPEHAELHLLLSMVTPLGWLERVPTYKEKKQELKPKANLTASLAIPCCRPPTFSCTSRTGCRSARTKPRTWKSPARSAGGSTTSSAKSSLSSSASSGTCRSCPASICGR